jgi:hypothetical protein
MALCDGVEQNFKEMYSHLHVCRIHTVCCCECFVTNHDFREKFLLCTLMQHISSKPADRLVIVHPLLCTIDQLVNKE